MKNLLTLLFLMHILLSSSAQAVIEFDEIVGEGNPFYQLNPGSYASPDFVDIDNDGDQDAFFALEDGSVVFFKNIGIASEPLFEEKTGADNPLNLANGIAYSGIAFADIDSDGDYDAFVSSVYAWVKFYKNTGTQELPVFEQISGAGNPLDAYDEGFEAKLAFADIDNDGDLDVFIGDDYGAVRYYKNDGTASSPLFVLQQGSDNPLDGVYAGDFVKPAFVDLDFDGDDDLLLGVENGTMHYFINTGSPENPQFTEMTGDQNPFGSFDAGTEAKPVFVNLDGDNDADLIAGNEDGEIRYYLNQTTFINIPSFQDAEGFSVHFIPTSNLLLLTPDEYLMQENHALITLIDISGKQVFSKSLAIASVMEVIVPKLPGGVFLLQVKAGNTIISKKLSAIR